MKKVLMTMIAFIFAIALTSCDLIPKEDLHKKVFNNIKIEYEVGDTINHVTKDVTLPTTTSVEGASISWVSSNPDIISITGEINRPLNEDVKVTLTLKVLINNVEKEQKFILNVIALEDEVITFEVTFEPNGGSIVPSLTVDEGEKVTKPEDPTKADHDFKGWYKDEDLTIPWNFDEDVVNSNLTLYAKWEEAVVQPIQLPAPIHGIGHQPRPVAHIALGPYEFEEGANGGFTGFGLVFTNLVTNEEYIWRINHIYKAGFDTHYNESNLEPVGIVLTPGNYKLEYFAMGNGVTTFDSNVSVQKVTFTIEKPQLNLPNLSLDNENKLLLWENIDNATSYEVYINGELQESNTSPFDLSILTLPGVYTLKVVAKAETHKSSESTINYIISGEAPQLEAPTNFSLNGFILSWDSVDNAIGYTITINDVVKQSSTNSFDLSQFDIGNQTVTVKVVALGNLVDYSDSNEAVFEALLPELLPRLDSMTIGDQNGDILGFGNGNYRLIAHLGHPVFQQADWNNTFRFVVKKDDVVLGELIGSNGQILHNPGSSTDFYGKILTNGEKYTVEISLIAKPESGHRDSLPLMIDFTFIK